MAARNSRAIEPLASGSSLTGANRRSSWRRSLTGVILAAIKDHDGPNDCSAKRSRASVYRLAFTPAPFARRFGKIPARPAKGGVVALSGYDAACLNELMPHPVHGWMSWVQILAPTATQFESLPPLLAESFELVQAKWKRRKAA